MVTESYRLQIVLITTSKPTCALMLQKLRVCKLYMRAFAARKSCKSLVSQDLRSRTCSTRLKDDSQILTDKGKGLQTNFQIIHRFSLSKLYPVQTSRTMGHLMRNTQAGGGRRPLRRRLQGAKLHLPPRFQRWAGAAGTVLAKHDFFS